MRLARAAVLSVIFCWISITPSPALAQLGLGSLVVNIASPASGSTVSGSITVSASVTIAGSLTVAGVQFKLDGANLGAADTSSPYAVSYATTRISSASRTTSPAARELLRVRSPSTSATGTVSNGPPPDTAPPTVSITSPSSGSTVSGTVTVTASASDNVGVAGVQ